MEKNLKQATVKNTEKKGALKRLASAARYLAAGMGAVADSFAELCVKEGEREARRMKSAVLGVLLFSGIFVISAVVSLARFPLGVYPAGFALLAALGRRITVTEKKKEVRTLETAVILTVFAGVLSSTAFLESNGFFYLLAYLIFFLARAGVSGGKMDEARLARVTFSAFVSVGLSLLLAALENFTVRGVFAAVSAGIITPVFSYLLCGFYMEVGAGEAAAGLSSKRRVYAQGANFALAYLFLHTIREVQVANVSVSFVLAVLLSLTLSGTRGPLYGAAAGMIGGMAQLSPEVSPALAVGGFFAGLFFDYSAYVAMMVSFVSACGYCMYSEGLESFGFFTADFLCALALFFPLLHLLPGKKERQQQKRLETDPLRKEGTRAARQKLRKLSEAFSSLSEVFYTVSDTIKKPTISDSSRLVSDCCAEHCSRCSLSGVCWGKEQASAVESTANVAAKLLTAGKVVQEDFSEPLRSKCISLSQLVETINRRFGEINGSFLKNNKTRLLAGEYSSVSRLLKSTAGELDRELEYNPTLESTAKKALKELGISYRRVAVFGVREMKIDVYGVSVERVSHCAERIQQAFGKAFSCRFSGPDFMMLEDCVVMRLRRARLLSLECAKSGCTKRGESVSGDHVGFFETAQNYFYTLICDGMGSGREAAFTSRLAAIFIEKLMHCATPKNVTLEMLNAFLMSKTDETFTTVDLLEIDLLMGEAHFIKAGAAPSYVLRGDRLHRIESRTPPAGVLRSMCAEQTSFRLFPGDFIILLSDGVEQGEERSALVSLFAERSFESATELCDRIFRFAQEQGEAGDDLSVSVVRVMNSK
ncbi:MAG: hypothetical protein E7580_01005 [Ruminococcaceae bacterium]|nr:hypothetical protein [Oscillospiraceae bacterium]